MVQEPKYGIIRIAHARYMFIVFVRAHCMLRMRNLYFVIIVFRIFLQVYSIYIYIDGFKLPQTLGLQPAASRTEYPNKR